ncbi:hypothetical protein BVI1335_910012 [Burkholderia vietnamiensis]|nr:hypothetical protein BVI1335_910012 [Burkholderia vietnamiensis]
MRCRRRAHEARPRRQRQLLHERARHAERRAHVRGRHLGARQVRRDARGDGRHGADLELPAAEQSVQRLQPDAGAPARLGGPMNGLHAHDRSPRGRLRHAARIVARAAMRGACRATPIGAAAREAA